jgi:hypothetical protein
LTACLKKIVFNEKMIEDYLSWVKVSASKSTYKLGIGFQRCEDKGEKSAPKFIPSSNYHRKEEALKPTKTHYPSIPKPSFMFCGNARHLDEFYFRHKRLERRRFEYARNSYCDEFFDFPPHSYSHASPCTYSRAFPQFSYGPNHRSYVFGSRENHFELRRFGYDPHPHRGDRFLYRPGFPTGGFHTHFEPRHLDGPRFPQRGSRPTRSNGEVQKIVKTSSGRMVKC